MAIMSGCDYLKNLQCIGTPTFLSNYFYSLTIFLLNCLGLTKAEKMLTTVKNNDIEQVWKKAF